MMFLKSNLKYFNFKFLIILFIAFSVNAQSQEITPMSEGLDSSQTPNFFFFNKVNFESGKAPKNYGLYFDNLVKRLGNDASKKVYMGDYVTIPESLVQDVFSPKIGQELWKFDGSEYGSFSPREYKVNEYQAVSDVSGNWIKFETDDNNAGDDDIYFLPPKDEMPETLVREPLSIKEVNDIISTESENLVGSYGKNRDEVVLTISKYKIETAIVIGGFDIEILTLSQNKDQYIDWITFIKFPDKVLIERGTRLDTVLNIADQIYFVLGSGGSDVYTQTAYKLNGEKLGKISSADLADE